MSRWTVGIDLAIRGLHVATLFDERGEPACPPIKFRLRQSDLDQLISAIEQHRQPDDEVWALMEPTGMAWYPIGHRLQRAGYRVIRVKGKRVKALRRYLSEYAKTDVADSKLLASIPNFGPQKLTPLYLPTGREHALKRLTKQRVRYKEQICSTKRRLLDLIRWAHPTLENALPDLVTSVSLAVLENYFDPHRLRRLGQNRLAAFVRRHVSGSHPKNGPFADQLAERLLKAARETIALHEQATVDFEMLQLEVRQEIELLRLHRQHIARLDQEIEALYEELHPEDHLRSIPGIGLRLAPSLLGVIHSSRRFHGQKQLRGFSGLFPRRNESGGKDRPGQQITCGGNNRLKRDLMLAADVARTVDPELALVYYRMMVEKGHHHRQALCAVCTRLVNRIYAVLKENRPYVLRDLDGNRITVAEARALIRDELQVPAVVRRARRREPAHAA